MSTTGRPSPTLPSITRYPGTTTLTIADHLRQAYAEVFSQPTWNEDHTRIEEFRHQLDTDAHRPGFRAVVATGTGPTIDGFATGWITRTPFPTGRSYDKVTDQLGPQRVNELLVGALEVNELAVRPTRPPPRPRPEPPARPDQRRTRRPSLAPDPPRRHQHHRLLPQSRLATHRAPPRHHQRHRRLPVAMTTTASSGHPDERLTDAPTGSAQAPRRQPES
jgi:hypothetical protein